ncbi:MAG: (Fe-S)-binding protein [Desulfobacteraceae bacterium]|nr:MAG: (Fe-S)-binding protein [Desulfobacteraceae bacterium]
MFQLEKCNLCGECLVQCQWMDVDLEQAVTWKKLMNAGEYVPGLDLCITCYACNEICPNNAKPFDLIAELQEKYCRFFPEDAIAATEKQYTFTGDLHGLPDTKRVMTTCVFGKDEAALIQGGLYDLPRVGGKPYFCWVLFSHMGVESIQRKHARDLVDRLAKTGAEEVVCFHDDCYAMLARIAPGYGIDVPFRPVHLVEYLVEYVKKNMDRIRPVHMDIAYQRPCASRHTPEKEHFIDELFELVGVRRVERAYDREKALCCAAVKMLLGIGDPAEAQERNIMDAKESGAQAMVYLCPMCRNNLSAAAQKNELPFIFIGDLVRMALGEISPA